jgi:hypothetical protein
MNDKARIKKLEEEVVELRRQLLDLALRQQPTIVVTSSAPIAPYSPNPVYPHYDGPVWVSPNTTTSGINGAFSPNYSGALKSNVQSFQ